MITFEQLPLKEQLELRRAFDKDPGTIELDRQASYFHRNKQFVQALQLRQEIDRQWKCLKESYIADYKKVVEETVKLSDLHLSEEILQPLLENIITLFICCSIIETAYFEADEILKGVNKDYSIGNFSDLANIVNSVKKKLKYLQDETGYMDDLYWYDSCDKHYEMIKNKARSILKKKGNIKRWGQNFRKYIDGTL